MMTFDKELTASRRVQLFMIEIYLCNKGSRDKAWVINFIQTLSNILTWTHVRPFTTLTEYLK